MDNARSGYDYLAHVIKGYGVSHVFYVEAMLRLTMKELGELGVKRIMAHTENAAAYMADGYARMAGKPGVCFAQSIGAANLSSGIHEAWLANSPVVALTGKKPPAYQYRGSYQEADHRLFYEAITKFNGEIVESQQLATVLKQCFRASVTGKPRPVHIDVPNHIGRTIEVGKVVDECFIEETYTKYPAFRPEAEKEMIAKAIKSIDAAKTPIIVIGRGAAISDAGKAIYELAQKGDIPIVTSPDGKALIDENDDLWAGIVGAYGMDSANKAVKLSDLVIFIGTQTGDQTTLDWTVPATNVEAIQIDIDPSELGKNYPRAIGLLGDAKMVTLQLLEAVSKTERKSWRDKVRSLVTETLAEYSELKNSESLPIRPERLCYEIEKSLPDNAVVVSDTGFSAVWSAIMMRMKPSQKYIRAAGSLGWSFPAAIGVKCAAPDRPVICFTGDGAFYYHMAEMETMIRNGIQTVTVINNNQALVQCTADLKLVYKDEPEKMDERYVYNDVNLSELAKAFGFWYARVEKPEDIGKAMKEALGAGKAAVIEVLTDRHILVPDPIRP